MQIDRNFGKSCPACPRVGRNILRITLIALAYFGAHKIALLFPDAERILAAVWPAGGIGLAALLLSPRRLWPALLAALFAAGNAANLLSGRPLMNSVGFMTANVLESLGAAWLISRWCGENVSFTRVKDVLALLCAATGANACTAFIGAGTAAFAAGAPFWSFWITWWIADGLGILLVAPLIVTWSPFRDSFRGVRWSRTLEAGLFLSIWWAAAGLSFQTQTMHHPFAPQPYLLVALLAWAALRLGQRGVTTALALLAVIAVTSDAVSVGPLLLGGDNRLDRLLLAQMYLACTAVTGLLLAASYAESKSTEQAAREEQLRIRALGDNLPNGMVYQVIREHDGRMRFLYVSAGVERLNGVSAKEVRRDPATLYGLIAEEDRALVAAAEEASARDLRLLNVVARFRRPDGCVRWMHLSSSPRRLADGRILWDGLQLDITERKQAEDALQEKTAELDRFFNLALDLLCIADTDGYFRRLNVAWETTLGYPRAELMARRFLDFVHPDDVAATVAAVSHLAAQQTVINFVNRYRCKDGTYRWIEWRSAPAGKVIYAAARDITDRKQSEDALQKSEARYRRLFQDAVLGIFQSTPDGKVIAVNHAFVRMFGYASPEEVQTLVKDVDADLFADPQRRAEILRLMQARPDLKQFENRYRRKDGSLFTGNLTAWPVKDAAGQILWVEGFIEDITIRKHAEEALRESEQRFRGIIEQSAAGYFFIDRDGFFREVNAALVQLYRYASAAEVLGKHFTLVQQIEDVAAAQAVVEGILRGDSRYLTGEFSRKCADGTIGYHTFSARPVVRQGEVVGLEGFIIDTTERKRTEELFRKSEARFQALFETMTEGVALHEVLYDEQGTPVDYVILDVNPAYGLHVGITRQAAVGKKASELYGAGTPPYFEIYEQVAATGEPAHFETYFSPLRKHFSISVCSPGKGQFATMFEDITERKRTEAEIHQLNAELEARVHQRTAELEAANKELNNFVYAASHDLKTPLRGINQLAQWLAQDYAAAFDAAGKELLGLLIRRVKRMDALINGILEYSRVGRMPGADEPLNLQMLVREVITASAPPAQIRILCEPELPTISAHKQQMFRVFAHLLENAIKFMDKPVGEVRIQCVAEGAYWKFSVADNGPGIAPKYQAKIFQMFQTLASRDDREDIGLGLALVKRIIESYGGKIWVESTGRNGSTFYFTFPRQRSSPIAKDA